MAKYRTYLPQKPAKPREPHPVWRGIGCVILIAMPILAWGIGEGVLQWALKGNLNLPAEWLTPPQWPGWMWRLQPLYPLLAYTQTWQYFLARVIFYIAALLFLSAFITTLYAFLYARLAPRDPTRDLVPRRKIRRYRR